jgi:leucyl aminopeptidase (aminopeptidase T)
MARGGWARWRWCRRRRRLRQTGILFWSTLFDENAASHIALGQAYSTCLIGGEKMDA